MMKISGEKGKRKDETSESSEDERKEKLVGAAGGSPKTPIKITNKRMNAAAYKKLKG